MRMLFPPRASDLSIRLVCGKDVVGDGICQALRDACRCLQPRARSFDPNHLRKQVVMVEYDSAAGKPIYGAGREQQVGWIMQVKDPGTAEQRAERVEVKRRQS